MCLFSISVSSPLSFFSPKFLVFLPFFPSACSLRRRLSQDVRGCLEIPQPTPTAESLLLKSGLAPPPVAPGADALLRASVSPSIKAALITYMTDSGDIHLSNKHIEHLLCAGHCWVLGMR